VFDAVLKNEDATFAQIIVWVKGIGHKSSRTTEIYTHVSTSSIQKISSHFDNL
jgi:site-specific recombinase XerD